MASSVIGDSAPSTNSSSRFSSRSTRSTTPKHRRLCHRQAAWVIAQGANRTAAHGARQQLEEHIDASARGARIGIGLAAHASISSRSTQLHQLEERTVASARGALEHGSEAPTPLPRASSMGGSSLEKPADGTHIPQSIRNTTPKHRRFCHGHAAWMTAHRATDSIKRQLTEPTGAQFRSTDASATGKQHG